MATPTLASVPTTIDAADALTNWNPVVDTLDPDIKLQGTNAVTGTWRNDLAVGFCTPGSTNVSGQHVRAWITSTLTAYMDTFANGGLEFYMSDGTNTGYWNFLGNDNYNGGWANMLIYANSTPDRGTAPNLTAVTTFGWRLNRLTAPKNIDNTWIDYLRYGDGYTITGGLTGDRVGLADIFGVDETNAYGILEERDTVYYGYGALTIGNGATATWVEWDGQVLVFSDQAVNTGLYKIVGQGSGCNIVISNSVLRSAGTTDATRFAIDMDDAGLNSLTMTDNSIVRAAATLLKSGQTATGNTFDDCGQITHGGATMNDSIVKNYEGTVNTSALIYNVNADPDGEMDNMTFEKGTAATHAIEFGTTSPLTMTLTGIDFVGYNAANAQNDSTFHVKRTAGTVTINLVGCTGNFSYRTDGATVVVQATVPIEVTVLDKSTGSPIQNANVQLYLTSDYSTVVLSAATNASGVVTASFAGTTPAGITGWARQVDLIGTDYEPEDITGTIGVNGFTITVLLDPSS